MKRNRVLIRRRNVKIIATLGPASDTPDMIRRLFEAGADIFRLNMSHLDHKGLKRVHAAVRQVEKAVGRPIGILVDLQPFPPRPGQDTGR